MNIQLPLTIKVFKDNKSKSAPWVAYTPELDIASCGPTIDKAKDNLKETIEIVLKGAVKDGNLKELLIDAGFEIDKSGMKSPSVSLDILNFNLGPKLTNQLWPA